MIGINAKLSTLEEVAKMLDGKKDRQEFMVEGTIFSFCSRQGPREESQRLPVATSRALRQLGPYGDVRGIDSDGGFCKRRWMMKEGRRC